MKSYILLIIIVLGTLTSCTLKRGVNEGVWEAFIIDPANPSNKIPFDLTINESKVYWDVYYSLGDSIFPINAKQIKDSLFLTDVRFGTEYALLIKSKSEIEGVVLEEDKSWYFEARFKE